MEETKYEYGKVYYSFEWRATPPVMPKCRTAQIHNTKAISSWVFAGERSCDGTLEFVLLETWQGEAKSPEWPAGLGGKGLSPKAAKVIMLTWDELLQALMEQNRIELRGMQFTLLAQTGQVAVLARVRIIGTSPSPDEGTFSILGTLLDGTPEPKRVALVRLGNGMSVTFRVMGVDCTKGTDKDLVSLTCRGSAEEVEVWSHLALKGRRLDVLETKWGLWIEPDSSDSDQHGR